MARLEGCRDGSATARFGIGLPRGVGPALELGEAALGLGGIGEALLAVERRRLLVVGAVYRRAVSGVKRLCRK